MKLRLIISQPSPTAASAMNALTLSRVSTSTIGNNAAGANGADCGKLKPIGSRHGPVIR